MGAFPEWRKMPRDVRAALLASEDYLTSRTFGLLRFLDGSTIRALLGDLGVDLGDGEPAVTLWPSEALCEPDATIETDEAFVLVEAKFIGSRLGYYGSQLGREWLTVLARRRERRGILLAVTNDAQTPLVPAIERTPDGAVVCSAERVSIATQVAAYCRLDGDSGVDLESIASGVRWCSWSALHTAVDARRRAARSPARNVLDDIVVSLELHNCVPFRGWSFPLPELGAPTSGFALRAGPRELARWCPPLPPLSVPPIHFTRFAAQEARR